MNREPVYRGTLSISEEGASIFVKGDTFKYGFDKKTGLINHLEVLGDDFLSETNSQIPDIYISDSRDPRECSYSARYENGAKCEVISSNPYEVHVRTHGVYHNSSGEAFPVRYRITYEIHGDGTIFVIINNKSYDPCAIRWMCISRGVLNPELCKHFSHLADQSKVDTTADYTFGDTSDSTGALFSGRLIPWFWFGNDRTGVEICVWDVAHHRYGATQIDGKLIDPLGEVGANVSASISPDGILWEIFSLRNLQTPIREGWEQVNYFSLSINPPKAYNSRFAELRVYWSGQCRHSDSHDYLSDDEIKKLAKMECNLVIGGINWRSGEFIPDNESEARRVISSCHEHGIKVIPCVPLMDLNEDTPAFGENAAEWRIEPVVEYEYETHLMCPGAEEWRGYWKQQIDRIAEDYDFDGVYLDFWYDKLTCRNPSHGCQRRYMRPTFPWVRDMMRYAWARFKTKSPDSVIISNTDMLPISMICSWTDVRSVGTSQDIRDIDPAISKMFYTSHRLGCNSLMWTDPDRKIDHHLLALSLLYMIPIPLRRELSQEEIVLVTRYWDILRAFGISKARFYPGFTDVHKPEVASTSSPDVYINVHKGDGLLLTMVNVSSADLHIESSINDFSELGLDTSRTYLIYDPVSRCFLTGKDKWSCDDLKAINVDVPGHSARLLYICANSDDRTLLFDSSDDKS